MSTNTSNNNEVIATRTRVNELLRLVPAKRYSDCTPSEQMRFNNLEAALQAHRIAVRIAKETLTKCPCCGAPVRNLHRHMSGKAKGALA